MAPSYFFSIAAMRQRPHSPMRTSRNGTWLPPKALGNNIGFPPTYFYHNGQTTQIINSLPATAIHYKTYSIYYNRAILWTVQYDATSLVVHDGVDDNTTTAEEQGTPPSRPDWTTISFRHYPNHASFVGQNLEHLRLRVQREGQFWAQQILPDPYTAAEQTDNAALGGLVGDLPLLIGLMALSVPETHVRIHNALTSLLDSPWQASTTVARGIGWQDGRGLVVSVYANPPYHTLGDLYQYETGAYGLILP